MPSVTISFTTGQALTALALLVSFMAMARCALIDFQHIALRSFGISGALGVVAFIAQRISWASI